MVVVCVRCGKKATEGSVKHPYCKECFKYVWGDDYKKYEYWLYHFHDR